MPASDSSRAWSSEPIHPSPMSLGYRAGLFFVALMMVLLPVIYVGLCVAALYGLYLYAINFGWLLAFHQPGVVAYFGVILAGLIGVVFMIKPLFSRQPRPPADLVITRETQPEVFALIEEVCDRLGAPRPVRVSVNNQVNASASFENGLWGFLTNRLVLTIGLPLAQGLTVTQFGGVIAHEFGHFTQAVGMRLNYVISTINRWFHRVIYERDSFDARLQQWSRGGNIWWMLMAKLAVGFVWLARKILWALMMAGHAGSAYMMRQMEYDADHYEIEVAGKADFKETFLKLHLLNAGAQMAHQQLGEMWKKGQLVDDVALFTERLAASIPDEKVQSFRAQFEANHKGARWYETHPSDYQRIARGALGRATGSLAGEGPAIALFRDTQKLAESVTLADYTRRYHLEVKPGAIVSTMAYLERHMAKATRKAEMRMFLGETLTENLLIFPSNAAIPSDWDAAVARLAEVFGELADAAPSNAETARQIDAARAKRAQAIAAETLRDVGVKLSRDHFPLPDFKPATIRHAIESAAAEVEQLQSSLAPARDLAAEKLVLLWRMAQGYVQVVPEFDSDGLGRRIDELAGFLLLLQPIDQLLAQQRKSFFLATLYLQNFNAAKDKKRVNLRFGDLAEKFKAALVKINAHAKAIPYPIREGVAHPTLAAFFGSNAPADGPVEQYQRLASAYTGHAQIYDEVMSELVELLSTAKVRMGLEPEESISYS